jgi:hypothetical protein
VATIAGSRAVIDREHPFRMARAVVATVGLLGWVWISGLTVALIWSAAIDPIPRIEWLYDWHVYAAGAVDLIERDLYRVVLEFPGWPLPVAGYKLPPFSAVWATPLLGLPDETAGIVWVALGALVWASAWWVALRLLNVPLAWAWTGIALALFSMAVPWFGAILLGNNNHLVLGLVVGLTLAHVRGHARTAGLLLGLAIATKLWPALILMPLLRERSWPSIRWSIGTAAMATLLPILWLGPDVIGPMIAVFDEEVPILSSVLWTSSFQLMWDWWPSWGGIAVAIVLLAIPARGLPAVGLAIIAGISVIPNIWSHYLPMLLVALAFVLSGMWSSRQQFRWPTTATLTRGRLR